MTTVHSFPPVSNPSAKLLLLGSMPGKASLRANQYYAHSRNAFWLLMDAIFSVDRDLPYGDRCMQLLHHDVAVWDVLKTCTRQSSLDSDIVDSSIVTNNFQRFYSVHKDIRAVFFNGAMAEKSYKRYILPGLPVAMARLPLIRLPSTSPAHAALSFEQKLALWKQIGRV